jgi:tight adherence protein B
MTAGLVVPVVMLLAAFCGYAFVLREDKRRRRVTRQLANATLGTFKGPSEQERRPTIWRKTASDERLSELMYTLLRYNAEASLTWPASRTVVIGVAGAFLMFLLDRMALPLWLALALAPVTALFAIRFLFAWQRGRYADRLLRQLPDAIQLLVSTVRVGMPVAEGFRILSREAPEPTRDEFRRAADELALGRPADEALLNIYRRTRVPEYAMFSVTLSVQGKTGGRLAETIQILGDTIQERIAIAGRAKALIGEVKFSAKVMAASPFILGGGLSLLHSGFLMPLFVDPRGRTMLSVGAGAWFLGVLTMRWMIKRGTAV